MTDSVRTRKDAKKNEAGIDAYIIRRFASSNSPCNGLVPYLQRRFHPCFFSLPSAHELKISLLLPDFGESHIGIDILKPGFVPTFHVCKLAEEKLLLCVS